MSALAKASEPGGIALGSGCGTKCRNPSSPKVKNTRPRRTRAPVAAWRASALGRGASRVEAARIGEVASMVISPSFGVVGFGFKLATNDEGADRQRHAFF